MSNKSLESISRSKFPLTDKGKYVNNNIHKLGHNYWEIYDDFFGNLRNEKVSLLEFGFGADGHCLETFADYFENCENIIGVDYEPRFVNNICFTNKKIKTFFGNQMDIGQLNELSNSFAESKINFDIIIDDAAHTTEAITNTFNIFFNNLKEGGFYVIEDTYFLIDDLLESKNNIMIDLQIAANYDDIQHLWSPISKDIQYVYTCRGLTIVKKGKKNTNL
jgi:cephalosporin hydroxylase